MMPSPRQARVQAADHSMSKSMGYVWRPISKSKNLAITSAKTRIRNIVILLGVLTFLLFFQLLVCQSGRSLFSLKSWPSGCTPSKMLDPDFRLESILQSVPSASSIEGWSRYYTSGAHFAGQGKEQGLWTKDRWDDLGIPETEIVSYSAFVGTPTRQRLALLELSEETQVASKVLYEAALIEDLPKDDYSAVQMPAFHGGSASGNVTAQFVYANFGLSEDYDDLVAAKVDFKGKIAVVKYGGGFRGLKVDEAVRRGIVGILIYTDPQQDGNITEANGYKLYPDGPARPSTYIERGSTETFRGNVSGSNPSVDGQSIPSLPVSYNDIIPLLKALKGHGPTATAIGGSWLGGGLGHRGIEYHTGPSPTQIVLHMDNQMSYVEKEVYNVFGTIRGSESEDVVILGNHRDSWTAGAGDPNSGSAALMEVVRSFALAYKAGWKPRRTLVFVSWEGEEVGQVGSRPWIRENLPWLSDAAVAYLNVVVAGAGGSFHAKASPVLEQIIHEATSDVESPDQSTKGQTVFDRWGGVLWTPGGGDAMPFINDACISTVDISFSPGPEDPTFPYHSNFDTFIWMDRMGDPGWKYHLTATKILSLMVARLVEDSVLKFSATDYAIALGAFVDFAKTQLPDSAEVDLAPLELAVTGFHAAALSFDSYAASLSDSLKRGISMGDEIDGKVREVNKKYMNIERQFCHYDNGYEGKDNHVLYATSAWHQNPAALPHLLDSFKSGNWSDAKKWRDIIRDKVNDATTLLEV